MPELKLIKDIQPEEINEQIDLRYELIRSMVGTLYPRVLTGEIEKLREIKSELMGEAKYEIQY